MKKEKDKQSYTKFCLKLNDINDSDIIDALWSVDNKTDYIRQLIRNDLTLDAYASNIQQFGGGHDHRT